MWNRYILTQHLFIIACTLRLQTTKLGVCLRVSTSPFSLRSRFETCRWLKAAEVNRPADRCERDNNQLLVASPLAHNLAGISRSFDTDTCPTLSTQVKCARLPRLNELLGAYPAGPWSVVFTYPRLYSSTAFTIVSLRVKYNTCCLIQKHTICCRLQSFNYLLLLYQFFLMLSFFSFAGLLKPKLI